MANPPRPPQRAAGKPRIDVQTPAPALRHNPFAQLAGAAGAEAPAAPAAEAPPPAADSDKELPAARGRLRLRRETKHRAGKAVILVSGFMAIAGFDEAGVERLAQQLKRQLGCGGTSEGGEILLQGDCAAAAAAALRALGFRVDGA